MKSPFSLNVIKHTHTQQGTTHPFGLPVYLTRAVTQFKSVSSGDLLWWAFYQPSDLILLLPAEGHDKPGYIDLLSRTSAKVGESEPLYLYDWQQRQKDLCVFLVSASVSFGEIYYYRASCDERVFFHWSSSSWQKKITPTSLKLVLPHSSQCVGDDDVMAKQEITETHFVPLLICFDVQSSKKQWMKGGRSMWFSDKAMTHGLKSALSYFV